MMCQVGSRIPPGPSTEPQQFTVAFKPKSRRDARQKAMPGRNWPSTSARSWASSLQPPQRHSRHGSGLYSGCAPGSEALPHSYRQRTHNILC
jgi:hypothetical protein